jgi:hypothetical protein
MYARVSRSFDVPEEATNIFLTVENMVFINTWRTLYSAPLGTNETVCIILRGTTLNPNVMDCL